jgi:hypothetical protein
MNMEALVAPRAVFKNATCSSAKALEHPVDRVEDFQATERLNTGSFPPPMPLDVVRGVSVMPNSKIGPMVGWKLS